MQPVATELKIYVQKLRDAEQHRQMAKDQYEEKSELCGSEYHPFV